MEQLRADFETLVGRRRRIWAQERGPDDPPGGDLETRPKPRLVSYNKLMDETTASTVEVLLQGSTLGISRQLLSVANRLTVEEAAALHRRFAILDDKLQAEGEHFAPGFQARPMRYFFNEMPADFTLGDFIGSWN
ncbi:MAG: hypothetical protein OXO50_04795 [Caldilineaceae bacterium]|nr:hypothetical protein [Caldilineaceae bacterium]